MASVLVVIKDIINFLKKLQSYYHKEISCVDLFDFHQYNTAEETLTYDNLMSFDACLRLPDQPSMCRSTASSCLATCIIS